MFELKTISRDAVPAALERAQRYRLLNEPRSAESICRDILRVQPDHQEALVVLLLALTDQFHKPLRVSVSHTREVIERLADPYQSEYYAGVACERWAKAQLDYGAPGGTVFDWLRQAMEHYEKAETMRPPDNDDALLRWNTCARIIKRNEHIRPRPEQTSFEGADAMHQDDVPMR